jgi:flagellar biosynthetic protein FlhB
MAEEQAQERTEAASPRRREEARRKGQVARSREVATVLVLSAGLGSLQWGGPQLVHRLGDFLTDTIRSIPDTRIAVTSMQADSLRVALFTALALAPVLIPAALAGIAASLIQGGFLWSPEALSPQFSRIDPAAGFGRLFSRRAFVNLVKSLLQVIVVGWIAWSVIAKAMPAFPSLTDADPVTIMGVAAHLTASIGWRAILALAVFAVADWVFERHEFGRSIAMTRQQLREEMRETEGDPNLRSRIRTLQRERSRRRMMKAVPTADVVVTNPVHLAIALRYDEKAMGAPRVVAKGARLVAQKIREIAAQHDIPIVENPPLAWALHRGAPLGAEIPAELYRAVAEVLAIAYRRRGRVPQGVR